MFSPILGIASFIGEKLGIKAIKYFVDSTFRDKVTPVPGSVLYCDLWVGAEHSGIYLENNIISNIVVEGFADSSVQTSSARDFTSKSIMGNKIYVSCDSNGSVGHEKIATHALDAVGKRSFYGLVFENCHVFSNKCVEQIADLSSKELFNWDTNVLEDSWEPTLLALKESAKQRINATKWRLWDWENDEVVKEPDWQKNKDTLSNLTLNKETIEGIKLEKQQVSEYLKEIADENIPKDVLVNINGYTGILQDILAQYDKAKTFLESLPGHDYSFNDLQLLNDDFSELAKELQGNANIQELVRKMGRDYISEQKKKKLSEVSKSEVYGAHQSSDLMRLLPSELVNLEDETLEMLFYARYFEGSLLTYELSGKSIQSNEDELVDSASTGPIIACLDTSGSMNGAPLIKAKATLLAIFNILKKEQRSLYVLIFGSIGQIHSFYTGGKDIKSSKSLMLFLQNTFGGGTDFETPLNEAFNIIELSNDYKKADVLMITDGICGLSSEYVSMLENKKHLLDFMIYTVLCAGNIEKDDYSDEIILL